MAVATIAPTKLADYPFPASIAAQVAPFAALIEAGDMDQARLALGRLTLEICWALQSNAITPREADQVFTLLDVFLTENYPDVNLGDSAEALIFEGQFLHHYGDEHGADLAMMSRLAKQLIDER